MRRHASIDWRSVRALLDAAAAIENAASPDPERLAAIYRDRAARLAERPSCGPSADALLFLAVGVGNERYGLEFADIAEVLPRPRIAPVPGAPPAVAGVMQVRGEIRPVLDLARLLDLPRAAARDSFAAVFLRRGARRAGLLVDRVEGIREFPAGECRPAGDAPRTRCVTPDLTEFLDLGELLGDFI